MSAWDYERVCNYLLALEVAESQRHYHREWVRNGAPRFLRTLELVPEGAPGQRCLEVGAMPLTMTLLLKKLRPYDLLLVDYFAGAKMAAPHVETVRLPALGEEHRFESVLCDLEREQLPFADASIHGALCCEVLEHLTQDPVAMLVEIHRVLLPDAWFVLTTPNIASFENVLKLLHGRNVFDPYDIRLGPTWRHNREYTPKEVGDLLTETGFVVEEIIVEDALPPFARPSLVSRVMRRVSEAVYGCNYGKQIYARARRGPAAKRTYPDWLFQHQHV